MAPQFVKPYVKTNKNDAADAQAICEAVDRPNMRFVPIKNIEQQALLALHRVWQGFFRARTAQANQTRGQLSEFGLIIPQGIGHIATRVPELIEDGANELPGEFRILVQRLLDHLKELDRQGVVSDSLTEQLLLVARCHLRQAVGPRHRAATPKLRCWHQLRPLRQDTHAQAHQALRVFTSRIQRRGALGTKRVVANGTALRSLGIFLCHANDLQGSCQCG